MATADIAMEDMDIDFTMEGDEDPEIARLQAEAAAINSVGVVYELDSLDRS